MYSIKKTLQIILFSILILLICIFGLYAIIIQSNGWMNPTVGSQIIASCATSLTVIVTLSFNVSNGIANRYQAFAYPKIISIKQNLIHLKEDIANIRDVYQISSQSIQEQIISPNSSIRKYGQYFMIKLYPDDTINRIDTIMANCNRFTETLQELKRQLKDHFNNDYILGYLRGLKDQNFSKLNLKIVTQMKNFIEENVDDNLITGFIELQQSIITDLNQIDQELMEFLEAN